MINYVMTTIIALIISYLCVVAGVVFKLNQKGVLDGNIPFAFFFPILHFILYPVYLLFFQKREEKMSIIRKLHIIRSMYLLFPYAVAWMVKFIHEKHIKVINLNISLGKNFCWYRRLLDDLNYV